MAVGGSLLLAFCPLIWMYSIQAEVIYTPPVLVTLRRLLLWCVCLLAHKTCVGQEAGTPAASWCARDTLPLGTQDWCRPLVQSQLVCLPPVALCLCACIICSCPGH